MLRDIEYLNKNILINQITGTEKFVTQKIYYYALMCLLSLLVAFGKN